MRNCGPCGGSAGVNEGTCMSLEHIFETLEEELQVRAREGSSSAQVGMMGECEEGLTYAARSAPAA